MGWILEIINSSFRWQLSKVVRNYGEKCLHNYKVIFKNRVTILEGRWWWKMSFWSYILLTVWLFQQMLFERFSLLMKHLNFGLVVEHSHSSKCWQLSTSCLKKSINIQITSSFMHSKYAKFNYLLKHQIFVAVTCDYDIYHLFFSVYVCSQNH